MSKKIKKPEEVLRNVMTDAFFRYYMGKMNIGEFVIRILRIDVVGQGKTKQNEELLKLIRNYQRGIIDEKCDCPLLVEPKQISFREYWSQRKTKKNEVS